MRKWRSHRWDKGHFIPPLLSYAIGQIVGRILKWEWILSDQRLVWPPFFLFVPMKNFAKGCNPSRHKVMGLRVFAIVIWPNYFIRRRLWCRQIGGQIDSNITNTTTHLLYNSKCIKTTLSLQSCLPKSNFSKWLKPFFYTLPLLTIYSFFARYYFSTSYLSIILIFIMFLSSLFFDFVSSFCLSIFIYLSSVLFNFLEGFPASSSVTN